MCINGVSRPGRGTRYTERVGGIMGVFWAFCPKRYCVYHGPGENRGDPDSWHSGNGYRIAEGFSFGLSRKGLRSRNGKVFLRVTERQSVPITTFNGRYPSR